MMMFVKYDSEDEMSLEKMRKQGVDQETLDRITVHNVTFRKALLTWLPFLNERGFLDVVAKE